MRVSRAPDQTNATRESAPVPTPNRQKTRETPDSFERTSDVVSSDPSRSYRIAGHITLAASVAALVGLTPFVGIAPAALLAVTGQALLLKGGYDPAID